MVRGLLPGHGDGETENICSFTNSPCRQGVPLAITSPEASPAGAFAVVVELALA